MRDAAPPLVPPQRDRAGSEGFFVMTEPLSLWTLTTSSPRGIRHTAAQAEEAGFGGLYVVDSQNLSGDSYVALAMAAFDQDVARAQRQYFTRLNFHFLFVARERGAGKLGRFR